MKINSIFKCGVSAQSFYIAFKIYSRDSYLQLQVEMRADDPKMWETASHDYRCLLPKYMLAYNRDQTQTWAMM